MIEMNKLSKIARRGKKRLGQGHGSGKGKTAGRGTKGQKARGKMSMTFSAGNLSLIKRLPLIRGKLRNQSILKKKLPVNVKFLNFLPEKSEVDLDFLIKNHIVKEEVKETGVKILGDGELKIALTVKLPCSKGARKKIEKAGGKVEN